MDRDGKDYQEKWFVLMHLLRDHVLYNSTADKLQRMKYFDRYVEYKALYSYIVDYCEELKQAPKEATVFEDFKNNMDYHDVPDNLRNTLLAKVRAAYAMSEQSLDRSFIEFFLANEYKAFVSEAYQNKMKADAEGDDEELYAQAKEFVTDIDKGRVVQITPTSIFNDLEENLSSVVRDPTGVEFMDIMLNGGTIRGELLGVLAPSGGGKSTVANMLLAACVNRNSDGWYYSTEQKLKGDLAVRHACLMTGASRDVFKGGYRKTPQAIVDLMAARKSQWEKHCKFMDISDTSKTGPIKSVTSLLAQVQDEYKNAVDKPGIIIIDWWGRLSDAMSLEQDPPITDPANKRLFNRDQLHKLKQLAEDIDVPIVVFHQLSGAANAKGPKAKLTAADAQEDKAFNNMFDFCIVLGNRDKDDVLIASTDKARGEAKSTVNLRLDGKHCKMIVEENDELEETASDLTDFSMGDMSMPDTDGFGDVY